MVEAEDDGVGGVAVDYGRTDGYIDESGNMTDQPPDYLVTLFIALEQLKDARKDILVSDLADTKGRYASIAITELEKLLAFVSIYLSVNDKPQSPLMG